MKSLAVLHLLAVALAAVPPPVPDAPVPYNGHKVYHVMVGTKAKIVTEEIEKMGLSFWKRPRGDGSFTDVVVPRELDEQFHAAFNGFDMTVMHENLGESIAKESQIYAVGSAGYAAAAAAPANTTGPEWFNSYHPYDDHIKFLKDLAAAHGANAEVVTSGSSLEGRPITGIHIFGKDGKGKKPAVLLHGTVHAREWISTMVVEYLAYTLLDGYKHCGANSTRALVNKYDYYIFPVANPDGFVYTQSSPRNRLWRKNRQPTSGGNCVGHDINRNWPYNWGGTGASPDPCHETYRGSKAGDAPETQALSTFLKNVKDKQGLKLFIDYHAYSQLFMTPYGYACDKLPSNNQEYQSLARGAVEATKAVHGLDFEYGPICSTIYPATGSSVDYVADVVESDYTFTVELRDKGQSGFLLPENQIRPAGEESFAGFLHLLQNMK